ncbi:MAG: sugar-binding protein [Polyangiaceae bacterium]
MFSALFLRRSLVPVCVATCGLTVVACQLETKGSSPVSGEVGGSLGIGGGAASTTNLPMGGYEGLSTDEEEGGQSSSSDSVGGANGGSAPEGKGGASTGIGGSSNAGETSAKGGSAGSSETPGSGGNAATGGSQHGGTEPITDGCSLGDTPCNGGIAAFSGTQNVDGLGDEFCAIPGFELSFANAAQIVEYNGAQGAIDNPSRATAVYPERAIVRVAWSMTHFHAFVRVFDPHVVAAENTDSIWNADGVELYVTTNNQVTGSTGADASAFHFIISPGAGTAKGFGVSVETMGYTGTHTPLTARQYATTQDAEGYTVELRYAWPMGTLMTAGRAVFFDVALNSASEQVEGSYVRDAQAVHFLGQAAAPSPCGTGTVQPYCDDRVWCPTSLK